MIVNGIRFAVQVLGTVALLDLAAKGAKAVVRRVKKAAKAAKAEAKKKQHVRGPKKHGMPHRLTTPRA